MRIAAALLGASIAVFSVGCGNGDDTLAPVPPADAAASDAKADVTVPSDAGGHDAATTSDAGETADAGDAGEKADAETADAETADAETADAGDAAADH
jgi:hypothetical protein